MKFDSKAIHGGGGIGSDPTGAVSVPIYQVSTYKQEGPGKHKGYEYSRTGNPTRKALEDLVAELEGGKRGLGFASGLAALTSILFLFDSGDHIICGDDVYGGTYRLLTKVFQRMNLHVSFVDTTDTDEIVKAVTPQTKAILIETPSNPLLKVTDLSAAAGIAHEKGALLIVDNTFLTPYFQRPLEFGADIVFHSATKYLGGHSDVVAGVAITASEELGQRLHFIQNATGSILGPQDSWLIARGIRTLPVRMKQHALGAQAIAEWLESQPKVKKVYYPGLPDHPGHGLAAKQTSGSGGMVSFEVADGESAERAVRKTELFSLAESLGGVESLISIPARMTHASIPAERRAQLGISDGLIRLSVGLEDVDDLIGDLDQALNERK